MPTTEIVIIFREAYYALKRDAAPGVDGMTWDTYEQGLDHRKLYKMENEAVIAYVTQIKGVGRWTAEMLLMFALGREDVFAIDDWGVQNAMILMYKLSREDKKAFREKLLLISQKWSPYRTYACMYLWRYKDNNPGAPKPGTAVRPRKSKAAAKNPAPRPEKRAAPAKKK